MNKEPFKYSDFTSVSPKAWKQQIQYELMGEDYNETLIYETAEGIKVKPFYTSEDLPVPNTLQKTVTGYFGICQEIYTKQANLSNQKALWCIEKGCDEIIFAVHDATINAHDLLQNIPSHIKISIHLKIPSAQQIKSFASFINEINNPLWNCNLNPLCWFFETGNHWNNLEEDFHWLYLLISELNNPILLIDARRFQAAGATMAHQLAFALSQFTEYALYLSNKALLHKITQVQFIFQNGSAFISEISKLRAFGSLWSAVTKEFNINIPCRLMSQASIIDKTLYSANTNLIRNNTALMASVLGGTHSFICTPYDLIFKKSNSYSERLAINQALIVKHECKFYGYNDPLFGSFTIEKLSLEIAEKALVIFKSLEASGGFIKGLKANEIQKTIKSQFEKELLYYTSQQKKLIGTHNKFQEDLPSLEKYPFIKTEKRKTLIIPLLSKRYAMYWEQENQKKTDEN